MAVTADLIIKSLNLEEDSEADTVLLGTYIPAAEEFVKDAVDSTAEVADFAAYKQFDMAVALLVEFWYMTRGDVQNADKGTPYQVVSMIQQLRGIVATK
ncbi:head-tail connector protein [Lacticaseibacillus jixiensis]|uniref:head-tail connector protein n=1 Tax=Lacticaseibacillus jixiensis TaxID=3231926 RepID=UPI0036F3A6B5